jgi:hypothetical protein
VAAAVTVHVVVPVRVVRSVRVAGHAHSLLARHLIDVGTGSTAGPDAADRSGDNDAGTISAGRQCRNRVRRRRCSDEAGHFVGPGGAVPHTSDRFRHTGLRAGCVGQIAQLKPHGLTAFRTRLEGFRKMHDIHSE